MRIGTLTIVLGWIICAVLSGCATTVVPDSHPPEPLIPNLHAVRIPQHLPEDQLNGTWGRGDGFWCDNLTLKSNHEYSETTMTDTSGPYTMHGRWKFNNDQVLLHPIRKSDQSRVEPLQVVRYKGKLILLPNAPGAHSDGWPLFACYKKD